MARKIFFSWVLLLSTVMVSQASVKDSVGLKVKNGKVYIMHQVDKGQGLYSIGRRYGVPYKQIIAANPGSEDKLLAGQIILVPTGKKAPMEEKVVKEYFEEKKAGSGAGESRNSSKKKKGVRSTFARFHTVKKGETLYGIARQYKTSTQVIMDLNDMKSSSLSEGQKILVPAGEDDMVKDEQTAVNTEDKINQLEEEAEKLKEEVDQKKEEFKRTSIKKYEKRVDKMPEFDVEKISETGNLYFSDQNELRTNKKVASHHEAPIGTTIMVTNPANNKAIFVKVVKNHEMDESKSNMILIPGAIAGKIGILDGQSVTTSYAR